MSVSDLIAAARAARAHAHAPYSSFSVGAALQAAEGRVFTGCNIESASFGLTMCAERVALLKALSEGHRRFLRLAVVTDTAVPAPPCGACRQLLWEFAGNIPVHLANLAGDLAVYELESLLPHAFEEGHFRTVE